MNLLIFGYGLHRQAGGQHKEIWKILRISIILFSCWLLSFLACIFILLSYAQPSEIPDPDFAVILGASLNGDRPGLTLEQRLLTGITYLKRYPDIPVIVSGGQGHGETISEAQAMKIFLTENGIPEERIILEDESHSTAENFSNTAVLIKGLGKVPPVRITIVTSDFHLFRAAMLAERNGFITGRIPAPTPGHVLPVNLLREYFALAKSFMFDR